MYYILKDNDKLADIISKVKDKGYVSSYWSCDEKDCAAIALYYNPWYNKGNNIYNMGRLQYILLNRVMAGLDYGVGVDCWVGNRTKCNSLDEMFSAMDNYILEIDERIENFEKKMKE